MALEWRWRLGFIHGYGDCAWQEMAGQIRRITKLVPSPQGVILVKALPCVAAEEVEPQFDGQKMVVDSVDPKEGLAGDLDRCWSPIQLSR